MLNHVETHLQERLGNCKDRCADGFRQALRILHPAVVCHACTAAVWQQTLAAKILAVGNLAQHVRPAAHGLLGLLSSNCPPAFRTEMPVEQFYGRIKAPFRGRPCLKDGVPGSCLEHLKQMQALEKASRA